MTTENIVRISLEDLRNKKLTQVQKNRLAILRAMPDSEVDLSDIPMLSDDDKHLWYKPGLQMPTNKQSLTMRVDADVLSYFKKTGRRYQTQINAVLRQYMMAHPVKSDSIIANT